MGLIEAIVLGLIQGLTEFLPVSSSGHVLLASRLIWGDVGAGFTAVIQLGTLLAVLIYFWGDLAKIFVAWLRSIFRSDARAAVEARMGWAVFIGTIPVVIFGLLFKDQIETVLRGAMFVAAMLFGVSILMLIADRMGRRARAAESVNVMDGFVVGLFQCLALIPGASRSGSTIVGGLFLGLDREAAARFSFLLSVPSVFGSGLYELFKSRHALMIEGAGATVIATLVAFVSGYAAIAFLMRYLQRHTLTVFIVYRIALAAFIVGLVFAGVKLA
ncbi:MAG TPA: undecaprenyl-diphosphate phosphatase [Fimbriimonadaceae bacterium]|nr:undecaprenyl-diphosphate phosphatase [Fimbriimonadaceae bacterium]